MLALACELANCDERFFAGWLIARVDVNILGTGKIFTNELLMHKKSRAVFQVFGIDENNVLREALKVLLLLPKSSLALSKKSSAKDKKDNFATKFKLLVSHVFNIKEVQSYLDYTKDKNIIHKQDLAKEYTVVPGLCMMSFLKQYLKLDTLHWQVDFLSPVYVDDEIYFYRDDENKMIYAYANKVLAFRIKIIK